MLDTLMLMMEKRFGPMVLLQDLCLFLTILMVTAICSEHLCFQQMEPVLRIYSQKIQMKRVTLISW